MSDASERLMTLVAEMESYKWELPAIWKQLDVLSDELMTDGTDKTITALKSLIRREREIIVKRFFGLYKLNYDEICEILFCYRYGEYT